MVRNFKSTSKIGCCFHKGDFSYILRVGMKFGPSSTMFCPMSDIGYFIDLLDIVLTVGTGSHFRGWDLV